MSHEQIDPERIDDGVRDDDAPGVADADPIAGARIDEDDLDEAVVPDDNAFEVDGPQAGHA